ncbi:hypothetical protein HQQ80_17850 [Microbacteriaceae bacterium VKM Ac-2855]|nr:hypothetical protein [Microbacteriaceae bacterium VKM Ac-2855]
MQHALPRRGGPRIRRHRIGTLRSIPLSGAQYTIGAGGYEAIIASVGASLRSLTADGRHLILPFAADEVRPAMRGAVLAPWPPRIPDGRCLFDGEEQQLVVDEAATRTASHGLAAWLDFDLVDLSARGVRLGSTIALQPGYPWRVRLDAEIELDEFGLRQTLHATNESATPAPVWICCAMVQPRPVPRFECHHAE